jgi:hypothetical protein
MQKRKWRKPKEKAITRNPTKNKKGNGQKPYKK